MSEEGRTITITREVQEVRTGGLLFRPGITRRFVVAERVEVRR